MGRGALVGVGVQFGLTVRVAAPTNPQIFLAQARLAPGKGGGHREGVGAEAVAAQHGEHTGAHNQVEGYEG